MDLVLSEEDDDDSETIAIQKEAARTLTVKGCHWAFNFIDEVTEICRNSNLFRKASLQKASIASSWQFWWSCSCVFILCPVYAIFFYLNHIYFLNLCMPPLLLHYILWGNLCCCVLNPIAPCVQLTVLSRAQGIKQLVMELQKPGQSGNSQQGMLGGMWLPHLRHQHLEARLVFAPAPCNRSRALQPSLEPALMASASSQQYCRGRTLYSRSPGAALTTLKLAQCPRSLRLRLRRGLGASV